MDDDFVDCNYSDGWISEDDGGDDQPKLEENVNPVSEAAFKSPVIKHSNTTQTISLEVSDTEHDFVDISYSDGWISEDAKSECESGYLAPISPPAIDLNHHEIISIDHRNASEDTQQCISDDDSWYSREKLDEVAVLKKSLYEIKEDSILTKRGALSKRRIFKHTTRERAEKKLKIKQHLHRIREPCTHQICNTIECSRRFEINEQFWNLSPSERCSFAYNTINRKDVKQRRKNVQSKKSNSFEYYLKNGKGEMTKVCKIFYLTTLGYSKSNDSFIKCAMGKTNYQLPLPRRSKQGKHLLKPIKDREFIIAHINSFNPMASHYRREHAPRKKYLTSEITISLMHFDFKTKHPDFVCSYSLYRRIVTQDLHISFTQLGNEQCELCEKHKLHCKLLPLGITCSCGYEEHHAKYIEARAEYDKQRLLNSEEVAYFTLDLQKVIMLPRLNMFKTAIFCPRIIAFNESFVPIGGSRVAQNSKVWLPEAVIWHEAIAGRLKEDIISAFYKFFISKHDVPEFVMWLDNCSSQNKNWALLSFLVFIVNSDLIEATKIQFNYFEPGHTFMSADNFHHQVELSMKKMAKVYDFSDFEKCVAESNSKNVNVSSMKIGDFRDWKDYSSLSKIRQINPRPYLKEMVQITATRGSYDLKYKKRFTSDVEFDLNFLMESVRNDDIPLPQSRTIHRGILKSRKENILKQLSPIILSNKLKFWRNIPVTNSDPGDLVYLGEDDCDEGNGKK